MRISSPDMAIVAPSRGRGSKLLAEGGDVRSAESLPHGGVDRNLGSPSGQQQSRRRSLTGAWIETCRWPSRKPDARSLPHGGVDRNGSNLTASGGNPGSLPHGGVDRNRDARGDDPRRAGVAPSRGRGSKHRADGPLSDAEESLPHGGVDRNRPRRRSSSMPRRRSLTGAWIETRSPAPSPRRRRVAPSRGRGSKPLRDGRARHLVEVAPSRGRGSKQRHPPAQCLQPQSLPHGGVDRNPVERAA